MPPGILFDAAAGGEGCSAAFGSGRVDLRSFKPCQGQGCARVSRHLVAVKIISHQGKLSSLTK